MGLGEAIRRVHVERERRRAAAGVAPLKGLVSTAGGFR